ncbi:MAG: hypothetical protein QM652_01470 [Legionella sp.]|uniref:hypothetical protein n=1 Tax=Legionella sp. TaxID=459 RepID=UPI0039E425B6
MKEKPVRVMWLLNDSTFRCFEIDQLAGLGITEVFAPKSYPVDKSNLSTDVDYSLDASLSIPEKDLALLNAQNWYENPSEEAWRIANEYFDVAIIGFFLRQIEATSRFFLGSIVLRAFGLSSGTNYTQLLYELAGSQCMAKLMKASHRFWFGAGYEHLKDIEGQFFQAKNCYLPVGLNNTTIRTDWTGQEKRILFVHTPVPQITINRYTSTLFIILMVSITLLSTRSLLL